MDDEFFSSYKKGNTTKGIPNVTMNQPLVENALEGTIGLELEIESKSALPTEGHLDFVSPKTKTMWRGVADGSLRGVSREYILSQPCARDEVPFLVNKLFERFNDLKSKVDNSNRCSTHVHINMKGKTVNSATSILALWAMFETPLIAWCGEERVTNHFCLSMQNSGSLFDAWDQYLKNGQFEGMGQDRHGLKYMALNILPLWRKGSFEFRCGGAPNDPEKVIAWATFLDKFVEYATNKYPNPQQIAGDISERGAVAIFQDICSKTHEDFFNEVVGDDIGSFNDMCMTGFRVVQPLLLGYPWNEWMDQINKVYVPDPFAKPKKSKSFVVNMDIPRFNEEPIPRGRDLPPGYGRDENGLLIRVPNGQPVRDRNNGEGAIDFGNRYHRWEAVRIAQARVRPLN